ncbi:MarR family transcriptional regulator [Microbacterium sp. SSW1-49]|uniref:MarR family transcriptional regulator n=1 Tax=Microbacterium croceum TaxID=2851645 RepID=A0ABT0FCD5_9MICO|nr:MarR family transcriptional regulator [Microbacterium croceum]MCK2035727.1 MarR family transcriptional regulator [Microbacterium croceum]
MDERESRAWLGLVAVTQLLPAALDSQLQREAHLTHFEFMVLTVLRFAPQSTLRMTALADATHATLARLSHVCTRLEKRGVVERTPSPDDRRATDVRLTSDGRRMLIRAMPGHIATARRLVIDALTPAQLDALAEIAESITDRLTAGGACPPDRD